MIWRRCRAERSSTALLRVVNNVSLLTTSWRGYAVSKEKVVQIFNRDIKLKQRERAAADPEESDYQYLRTEVASRLTNRLHVRGHILTLFA